MPAVAAAALELAESLLGTGAPLRIRAWDGSEAGPPSAPVTIVLRSPDALRHLLWAPGELGLGRAYVSGAIDLEGSVFDLLAARDHAAGRQEPLALGGSARLAARALRMAAQHGALGRRPPLPPEEAKLHGRRHSVRRDRTAVQHHYDVGNDFYRLVLGPSLVYSCGYWPEATTTLDEAQAAKCELVCRKLALRPGDRLLDVGCGWGTLAMHAARRFGARVVGVTISEQQAALARQRVEAAGLGDVVDIRLSDYRDVTDGTFDAVSSIGMFEHVGRRRMTEYLGILHGLLRPGGRLLNHAISRPAPDRSTGIDDDSFVGRYVFPDGDLLEVGTVVTAAQSIGFEARDVESLREHYGRTLRAWVANLEANWDEAVRLVGEGRARVWLLYMAGSAVGFEAGRISIHQVLAVRPHPDGRSDMPPTRAGFLTASEVVDVRSADGDPREARADHGGVSGHR
jgi:cyclopropane-fatty-acyl-phospholipid synthase